MEFGIFNLMNRRYRSQDPAVRRHPVFAGLSTDVQNLSRGLPGIHPFLRKYLRRLARELP